MEKIDGLSRRLDWKVRVENDNENQTLIREEWIHSLVKVIIEGFEADILEKIKIAREKDGEVEMKKVGVKVLYLVLKKEKVYVLKNKELRVEIIQLHHNIPVVGYKEK